MVSSTCSTIGTSSRSRQEATNIIILRLLCFLCLPARFYLCIVFVFVPPSPRYALAVRFFLEI